jgi:hypothetical protein
MGVVCAWLIKQAARVLESAEHEAVTGDLQECGDSPLQALRGVAGLVLRRQCACWKHWQPWLALVGIAGVVGFLLNELIINFDGALFGRLLGIGNFRTDNQEIGYLVCLAVVLALLSWIAAFTLTCLSERAAWFTSTLLCLSASSSLWVRILINLIDGINPVSTRHLILAIVYPTFPALPAALIFVVLPVSFGLKRARRSQALTLSRTAILAISAIIATALLTWTSGFYGMNREAMSHGMYHATPWQTRARPLAILSWPTIYLVIRAFQQWLDRRHDISTASE